MPEPTPGLYPENPVECDDCHTHFQISPGHATDGLACPECGGKRLFMNQPSPTQSDGTLRDMVDSASQKDQGGNSLGLGTIMGSPGNGTATQPAWRRDEGTYGSEAGISAMSVTQKVEMPVRMLNMEPYMPWTHEAFVKEAPGAITPEQAANTDATLQGKPEPYQDSFGQALTQDLLPFAGMGAALGLGGEAAAAGGEAAAGAAGASAGLGSLAQRFAPTLMKGVMHAGEDALGGGGSQAGGMQPEQVTPAPNMMSYGSADIPFVLIADLETPNSFKSVDEQHDDPEEQDQKEFNDGDDSPSNHKNPNNEDSGIDGEDGVRNDTPGYGFGENSPGLERMMMVLPLLLHYFDSPDSGEADPIIKALHDTLEQENPGYLKQEDPEGHNLVQMVIQQHKTPHGVHAGVGFPSGLPPVPTPAPTPGGAQQGAGTCPTCGGPLGPGGQCPQCAAGGMGAMPGPSQPGGGASLPPMMANHIGPVTPEQIEAVAQLLISQGRSGEIETMKQAPQLYQKELQEVQQSQQPPPPLVDPSQTPPPPMEGAPGAMPSPDMMGGNAGGQPMQPMSGFMAHLREAADYQLPQTTEEWHDFDPGEQVESGYGQCPRCGKASVNLGGHCQECGYRLLGEGAPYDSPTGPTNVEHEDWGADQYEPRWGKTADANNLVPRCPNPKCKSATTSLIEGADNDLDGSLARCHSCFTIFKLPKPKTHEARHVWAEVPNPVMLPANEQHAPVDREHTHDPSMAWVDNSGNGLQANQVYELHSPAFPVPDIIRVLDVKPDEIRVDLVGQVADPMHADQDGWPISRQEAQLEHYTFVPHQDDQDIDSRNTEPPTGTPGLEQVPPSGPTTDELQDSYPNTAVSHVQDTDTCLKCGSAMVDHTMSSPTTTMHECVRCAHAWETKEDFEGREAGVDLEWLLSSSTPWDDHDDMERYQAMAAAGQGRSRDLASIAAKDERYLRVKAVLDAEASRREAGRHFSPGERRELIDEHGHARNLGDLDLSNTHYDTQIDYTGKANGDNAPDEHLIFGL